jgi:hypothetical protein
MLRLRPCPACGQRVTSREACPSCTALAETLEQLGKPNAGRIAAYPFGPMRKLSPDVRREIGAAITRNNDALRDEAMRKMKAESDAALDEMERELRADRDVQ